MSIPVRIFNRLDAESLFFSLLFPFLSVCILKEFVIYPAVCLHSY